MAKKSGKKKARSGGAPSEPSAASPASTGPEVEDERFASASRRPQFRRQRDSSGQSSGSGSLRPSGLGASLTEAIRSDDRFAAALDGERFGVTPARDKYGRKTKKKKKRREEEEKEDDEDESGSSSSDSEEEEADESTKPERNGEAEAGDDSMEARIAYLNALSRGDVDATSSSSSGDDSSSDSDSDSDDSEDGSTSALLGKAGVLDPSSHRIEDVDLTHDESRHLCVLNLNWDHVRAVDVYAMVRSFCPPGTLERVAVYPSDFGRERMERERREGPRGLWKRAAREDEEGEGGGGDEDGSENDSDGEPDEYQEPLQADGDDRSENDGSESDSDEDEDILNLNDATSRLYSHFPAQSTVMKNSQLTTADEEEDGFDIERLRRYEASKLRYYFAIATFANPQAAESVYESIDGLEMGHTAAEVDARILPMDAYDSTVEGREVRDECTQIPARYEPNDTVVTALRQSRVSCSWEKGDADREARLTRYGMGKESWEAMATGDDIGVYLATSDVSSGEDSDGGSVGKSNKKGGKKKGKADKMRAMLGLAGSDDDEAAVSSDSEEGSSSCSSSDGDDDDEPVEKAKQVTFTPGGDLESKIRAKLSKEDDGKNKKELSPFEKYLERRKEKRRERRQAARGRKGGEAKDADDDDDDDGGMYDQDHEFGEAKFSDEEDGAEEVRRDGGSDDEDGGFFAGEPEETKDPEEVADSRGGPRASTKEELELLIAGDAGEFFDEGLTRLPNVCENISKPFLPQSYTIQTRNTPRTTTCGA